MRSSLVLRLAILIALMGPATGQSTVLISSDPAAVPGNGDSLYSNASFDGLWVAFDSKATNLHPGATNGLAQIFVKSLFDWSVDLISVSSNGVTANGDSGSSEITPDGRYVLFSSAGSNLVSGDTNGVPDMFLRDRLLGTTTRENLSSSGAQLPTGATYGGGAHDLSADGRYVVFGSNDQVVSGGPTGPVLHLYWRDRATGTVLLVTASSSGTPANSNTWSVDMSSDGRFVVFSTGATNLVAGDTNGVDDVFLRDVWAGTTTRVSVDASGAQGNDDSVSPKISLDGRFVTYTTRATNIVTPDTNGETDAIVYEVAGGAVERVSTSSSGLQANNWAAFSSLSFDGRYVTFRSGATNLAPGNPIGVSQVYVRDRATGITELASLTTAGAPSNGVASHNISPNGRFVCMWTEDPLDPSHPVGTWQSYVHDRGLVCITPYAYCTGKTNSLGCVPWAATYGCSSASADEGFYLLGGNVRNNKQGLLFYGVNGQSANPFQGGVMCVNAPKKRTPVKDSLGNPPPADDCSGLWVIDMNEFAAGLGGGNPIPELSAPGTIVDCQWWGRDPGAPFNTSLTNAVEYLVGL